MSSLKQMLYHTANNSIGLELLALEEPNYGRCFWSYAFYVNGKQVKNPIVYNPSEGLQANLDNYEFASEEGHFVFIPKHTPVLYTVAENSFISLSLKLTAKRPHFLGNIFLNDFLLIIYRTALVLVDLTRKKIVWKEEYKAEEKIIDDFKRRDKNKILVEYQDAIQKKFVEKEIDLLKLKHSS